MDDQLFEPTPPEDAPKPASGEGAPDKGASPPGDTEVTALRADVAATNKAVGDLTATLKGLVDASQAQPVPAAVEPEAEPVDASDALNQLASDPTGFIEKHAQEIFDKSSEATYAPVARQMLLTQHDTFMSQHESDMKEAFGDAAWDEIFVPAMQPKIDQIKANNPALLGRSDTTRMLVNEAKGLNMDVLSTRRAETTKAAEDAEMKRRIEIAETLPTSGMRRTASGEGELSADAKLMLSEIDRATGSTSDTKTFVKLHNTGNTLSDYIAATGGKGGSK